MEKISGRLGPENTLDKEWVEQTDKRAAQARAVPRAALSAPALSLPRPRSRDHAPARRNTSGWRGSSTPPSQTQSRRAPCKRLQHRFRSHNSDAHLVARATAQEAIRLGHTELGEHLAARGDLQGAFKAFVRSRDYCATPAHIIAMCLAVVRIAAEMNNFNHVSNYVQKAETVADAGDALTNAMARTRGLACLSCLRCG